MLHEDQQEKKKQLIFIKHIYDPNPVLVCMADFCNKYPNSQWPDTTIKVYFLLVTEPKMQEADHCRLPRGSFNKQENFFTRLVLGSHKMSKSSHTHAKS